MSERFPRAIKLIFWPALAPHLASLATNAFFGKCQMSFRGEQSRQRPVRDDPGYPGRYSFRTSSGNLAIFAYSEEKWIRDVESRIRRAA